MGRIYIDAAKLDEKENAHNELAAAFAFPGYYGRNLDALADCLGEICQPTEIVVEGRLPTGGYAEKVQAVLTDCANENACLTLLFPDEEAERLAAPFFETMEPPVLKSYPTKNKKQLAVLRIIARQFQPGRTYTEPEVNAILAPVNYDHVTLRRLLVVHGFLARMRDGSAYWRSTGDDGEVSFPQKL